MQEVDRDDASHDSTGRTNGLRGSSDNPHRRHGASYGQNRDSIVASLFRRSLCIYPRSEQDVDDRRGKFYDKPRPNATENGALYPLLHLMNAGI
jgi:hypothetical protein